MKKHILETLKLNVWDNNPLTTIPIEIKILHSWGIISNMDHIGNPNLAIFKNSSLNHLSAPPWNAFKLNSHGASNGNPGLVGFGGVIRNAEGKIQGVF